MSLVAVKTREGMWEAKQDKSGKVPNVLLGLYTSEGVLKKQIEGYVQGIKNKIPMSKRCKPVKKAA